jgi:hypothetical protein
MSTLELILPEQRTAFEPNEVIQVIGEWTLEPGQTVVEMRLTWYTSGKGGTDCEVIHRWRFDNPGLRDSKAVEVTLPNQPYSFSGKLISLRWAFELIAEPSGESTRADFVLSPSGREIVLHAKP